MLCCYNPCLVHEEFPGLTYTNAWLAKMSWGEPSKPVFTYLQDYCFFNSIRLLSDKTPEYFDCTERYNSSCKSSKRAYARKFVVFECLLLFSERNVFRLLCKFHVRVIVQGLKAKDRQFTYLEQQNDQTIFWRKFEKYMKSLELDWGGGAGNQGLRLTSLT